MFSNIGSALLILGSIYFYYTYGLNEVITIFLCLCALATWAYAGFSDERKTLFLAQIRYYDAKADYYKRSKKDAEN